MGVINSAERAAGVTVAGTTDAGTAVIRPTDTLVLVTHKGEMLELVERVIVIANQQVVLDGPKAQVLQKLQTPPGAAPNTRAA